MTRRIVRGMCGAALGLTVAMACTAGDASGQVTIQQHCSAQADAKGLSGQARWEYRRACLERYQQPALVPTPRESACSAQADALGLTGQARFDFRAGCLRRP